MQFTVGVGKQSVTTPAAAARQNDVVVAGVETKSAEVPTKVVSQSSDPDAQALTRAWDLLGLRLEALSDVDKQEVTSRSFAGAKGNVKYNGGLRIVEVKEGSVASRFIREGDILLGLDGFETLGAVNLSYILKADRIQKTTTMKCQIYRKGTTPLEGTLSLAP
jgi:hypothetical protein